MKFPRWAALALGLSCLSGCSTFHWSQEEDDLWIAGDKAQHFGLSAAAGFGTTWTARTLGAPAGTAAASGFTITLSGGLLKELWDGTQPKGSGWSWKDLAWDLAGATAGTWAGTAVPTPPK